MLHWITLSVKPTPAVPIHFAEEFIFSNALIVTLPVYFQHRRYGNLRGLLSKRLRGVI